MGGRTVRCIQVAYLAQQVSGRKNREDLSPFAAALYVHIGTIEVRMVT